MDLIQFALFRRDVKDLEADVKELGRSLGRIKTKRVNLKKHVTPSQSKTITSALALAVRPQQKQFKKFQAILSKLKARLAKYEALFTPEELKELEVI